jgi:hypothetical protein
MVRSRNLVLSEELVLNQGGFKKAQIRGGDGLVPGYRRETPVPAATPKTPGQ